MIMTVDKLGRGIVAGFLATVALSVLFDPIALAARAAGLTSPSLACLMHFIVGSLIWGAAFAALNDHLYGPAWLRGVTFGVAAWAVVVLAVLSLRREGFAHVDVALVRSVPMLVLHMIYGALLGGIYSALMPEAEDGQRNGSRAPRQDEHAHHDLHPIPR
jgi:hypothetical protein